MPQEGQGPPPQVKIKSIDDYLKVMSKLVFQSGMSSRPSGTISNTLGKDFKFMGPFSAYAFLYIVGENVISHDEFCTAYCK